MRPARVAADSARHFFGHPFNPFSHTFAGRHAVAACEVFERATRRYSKPEFGLTETTVDGVRVAVQETCLWEAPFCRLVKFERDIAPSRAAKDPRVLLVAPMSGHFATLLRGTVEALLPDHEVLITDWLDARDVPLTQGHFDLDDYIVYLQQMFRLLDGDVHVFAVCQSAVPSLAAVAMMETDGEAAVPRSLIMAGGPIDTRVSPTVVNDLAERRGTNWFRNNVITNVPWPNVAAGRAVYPGFLQLTGFMSMNLDRHAMAHKELFLHLVHGDGDSAEKHRAFYDEYLAVMDLTAEFYLQTIDTVFVRHALPKGEMMHKGRRVDLTAIRRTALMTIEGERDDITGLGQCKAAIDLCAGVAADDKLHYECPGVGHYGIFNGSRFRSDIAPRVAQFMRTHDPRATLIGYTPTRELREAREKAAAFEAASALAFSFAATR
jgi:poly(3-hydroxybutyrate) depolymerase